MTSIQQTQGPAAGVLDRIARAWRGARPAAQEELASGAQEPRLLAYAMGGCFALWLAQTPVQVLSRLKAEAAAGQASDVSMLVTANLVSMLFFTPLMLYGVAALARLILRAFGGQGDWFATRHMVFWSLIVAAPAILLGGLVAFGLELSGAAAGLGRWSGLPLVLANLVWLRFWAEGLAAAHGFRSGLIIFAAMAGLAAALSLAAPGVALAS